MATSKSLSQVSHVATVATSTPTYGHYREYITIHKPSRADERCLWQSAAGWRLHTWHDKGVAQWPCALIAEGCRGTNGYAQEHHCWPIITLKTRMWLNTRRGIKQKSEHGTSAFGRFCARLLGYALPAAIRHLEGPLPQQRVYRPNPVPMVPHHPLLQPLRGPWNGKTVCYAEAHYRWQI
jgi:hypothetical protein